MSEIFSQDAVEPVDVIAPEDGWMPPSRGTGWDLVLYFFGGFGLFLVAGIFVGLLFKDTGITLGMTALALILNVIFVGGSAYVLGIRRGKISWAQLGITPPRWQPRYFLLATFVAIGMMPLRGAVGLAVEVFLQGNLDSLQARADLLMPADASGWAGFMVTLIGAGILVPISEELYFRGLLHTWFRQRMPMWGAVLTSSMIFGFAHFDSLGVLVSSFIMGVVMAWLFEKTRSLWLTIAIHMVTNSVAVVLLYGSMFLTNWLSNF